MAAKVGPAAVSYGIGVQNRYAAFLDDEDALTALAINNVAVANAKRQVAVEPATTKLHQKNPASAQASSRPSTGPKNSSNKTTVVKSGQNNFTGEQPSRSRTSNNPMGPDGRQRRPNQFNQGANNAVQNTNTNNNHYNRHNTRNTNNFNQANNNNRFMRNNQSNNVSNHHQSNVSHSNHNKENSETIDHHHQQGKFVRNNGQRSGFNQRRQFLNDDQKTHLEDSSGANPFNNSIAAQTEEEKRRRQQKRALDLKYKDPEKREARRQQPSTSESSNLTAGQQPHESSEIDKAGRGFKGAGAPRARGRREGAGPEPNGEHRQNNDRTRQGASDRPQRNRSGFNNGSRGSRSSRSDEHSKSDRQRPIPNFSDKLDFPSLAS